MELKRSLRPRLRRTLVLVGLVQLVALAIASTSIADIPKAGPLSLETSPNWSGYAATNDIRDTTPVIYTYVTGTWTVPKVTCRKGNVNKNVAESSTVFVGLGGYATLKQQQIGTDGNCTKKGIPNYYPWFEVVPYRSYPISIKNRKVDAGDTVKGVVKILTSKLLKERKYVKLKVRLQMFNLTKGWEFHTDISWSLPDTTSANLIVSAPATCVHLICNEASLTNFGTVNMRDISIVGDDVTGTLIHKGWRVVPIRLVPTLLYVPTIDPEATEVTTRAGRKGQAKSPAGATPSGLSPNGDSFSVKWIPNARKGV